MNSTIRILWVLMAVCLWTGCRDENFGESDSDVKRPIVLSGEIDQLYVSRVNDNGFADGDVMGSILWITRALIRVLCKVRETGVQMSSIYLMRRRIVGIRYMMCIGKIVKLILIYMDTIRSVHLSM